MKKQKTKEVKIMNYKLIARRLRAMADELDGGDSNFIVKALGFKPLIEKGTEETEGMMTIPEAGFLDKTQAKQLLNALSKEQADYENNLGKDDPEYADILKHCCGTFPLPDDFFCSFQNNYKFMGTNNGYAPIDLKVYSDQDPVVFVGQDEAYYFIGAKDLKSFKENALSLFPYEEIMPEELSDTLKNLAE